MNVSFIQPVEGNTELGILTIEPSDKEGAFVTETDGGPIISKNVLIKDVNFGDFTEMVNNPDGDSDNLAKYLETYDVAPGIFRVLTSGGVIVTDWSEDSERVEIDSKCILRELDRYEIPNQSL